jgi:tellurite resistance protein TerC
VFTATAFSLLGLRQLYFLIDGLLDRLIFLSYGLAAILGFIGVKLVLHALHENTLPFINGGEHVPVFEIETGLSLAVIVGILIVTVLLSLLSPAGRAHTVISDARSQAKKIVLHADSPEDIPDGHHVDEVELETSYTRMVERQKSFANLKPKHQAKAADDEELQRLLTRAHELHGKNSDSRGLL